MSLASKDMDNTRIVTVQVARIDAAMAIQFKEDMRQLTMGAPPRVVLDLAHVDFVDSSGLGAIVAVMKQMPTGTRLDLAALSPTVSKVFRLTRMDTVFQIFGNLDEALGVGA